MSNKTQEILQWLDAQKNALVILTILETDPELAFQLREKQRSHEQKN